MKKYLLTLLISLITLSASAQDIVNSFIEKYDKDENLEIVSIGKKMFEMMGAMSTDNPEFIEAIKGMESIRIVSSKEPDLNTEYYSAAQDILSKTKGFEEILSSKENDEQVLVMIRESKGVVKELVLLSGSAKGFNLIALNGDINMKTLVKFAGTFNIKGLEKLDSVEKKY